MRNTPNLRVEKYRVRQGALATGMECGNNGAFMVPWVGMQFAVIVSDNDSWDHVSVSLPYRCPKWEEMCHIRELFFRDDETVMQLHPAKESHVNNHPYCLHLWRPQNNTIPLPKEWMVGVKGMSPEEARANPASVQNICVEQAEIDRSKHV